jgi:predicted nucleic acid-binding protein
MRLIADSTVLIDMWRLRREPHRLLQLRSLLTDPVMPWQVLFEFARGAYRRGVTDEALQKFLSPFALLPMSESQVWQAARVDADLTMNGQTIGAADTWIAAAALETDLPVLTKNVGHFIRIPGVQVIGYSILP